MNEFRITILIFVILVLISILIKSSRSRMIINSHSIRLIGFFNKILTLKNDNKFSFYSLNRIFALSFHKISCISE